MGTEGRDIFQLSLIGRYLLQHQKERSIVYSQATVVTEA